MDNQNNFFPPNPEHRERQGRPRLPHSLATILRYTKVVFVCILCALLIFLAWYVRDAYLTIGKQEEEIDNLKHKIEEIDRITVEVVSAQLQSVKELASAQIIQNGFIYFQDGSFLAKKSFTMYDTATAKAGINFEKFTNDDIIITDTEVIISLPTVEILSMNIDNDNLRLFDERESIFNPSNPQDIVEALHEAEEDLNKNLDKKSLLAEAEKQSELLIRTLLTPTVGDRTLTIKFKPAEENS